MSFSLIANLLMTAIYIGCGLFLLLGNNVFEFTNFQKIGLASILLIYGLFRGYIVIRRKKEIEKNDEE